MMVSPPSVLACRNFISPLKTKLPPKSSVLSPVPQENPSPSPLSALKNALAKK